MPTYYEWDIEETDEHDDIVDHDFRDKLNHFRAQDKAALVQQAETFSLVLVRNVYDRDEDLIDRGWAYAELGEDGKLRLPERFDNAANGPLVPARFHVELERWQK